ncbi:gamma-glutamylcyclotransferase [bacterium]|nr:gamma-glutamylcyclotransferase [bacterium]
MSVSNMAWFVYGSLKPGELGFRRVERYLERSRPALLRGHSLALRDGLPVVVHKPDGLVHGYVLEPVAGEESKMDAAIASFEDPATYKSQEVAVEIGEDSIQVRVRLNLAKHPGNGRLDRIPGGTWSVADDLLFRHALPVLYEQAHEPNRILPDSNEIEFWRGYLPLMGTVLNLWTVFERYVAFAQPALDDETDSESAQKRFSMNDHIRALHDSEVGLAAIATVEHLPSERVFRSDHVRRAVRAHVPWEQWYTVRNNAAHRGKSAIRDIDVVRETAMGLSEALAALLGLEVPELRDHYAETLGL